MVQINNESKIAEVIIKMLNILQHVFFKNEEILVYVL